MNVGELREWERGVGLEIAVCLVGSNKIKINQNQE